MISIKESAGKSRNDRLSESIGAHVLYVVAVAAFAAAIPPQAYGAVSAGVLGTIGFLAMWRYGWGFFHFIRALLFRKVVFPRMRRSADRAVEQNPPNAFLLVTTFRIDSAVTMRVYKAACEAALAAPGKVTIVASVVEAGDQRLIKTLFQKFCGNQDKVDLIIVRIAGTGKRDALAYGFRAIARRTPCEDDVVAVIDGDSIVPPELDTKMRRILSTRSRCRRPYDG